MRKNITIIFLFLTTIAFSQKLKVENDEIEIQYHWTREIVKNSIWTSVKLNSDNSKSLKNIYVKLKMTSTNKKEKEFEINKFILIDDKNKLKIRPNNISYQVVAQVYPFQKLSTDKDINVEKYKLQYNSEVKDYFKEYEFSGYETLEIPINYNTKENPELHITYFKPLPFKKKKISLFYAVPSNINNATLYYGNEKIANLKF